MIELFFRVSQRVVITSENFKTIFFACSVFLSLSCSPTAAQFITHTLRSCSIRWCINIIIGRGEFVVFQSIEFSPTLTTTWWINDDDENYGKLVCTVAMRQDTRLGIETTLKFQRFIENENCSTLSQIHASSSFRFNSSWSFHHISSN